MIQNIESSVKNYLASIGSDLDICDKKEINGYIGKISIDGDKKADIYVVIPKNHLDAVCEYWFGDTNCEIEDLTKEIANLIVGNSKVVASENNLHFDISIPEFLGEYKNNIEYDKMLAFKYKESCFYILLKEK